MKTYYLIARKEGNENEHTRIFVSDNAKGLNVLEEFQAKNFIEAQRKYFFEKNIGNGDVEII